MWLSIARRRYMNMATARKSLLEGAGGPDDYVCWCACLPDPYIDNKLHTNIWFWIEWKKLFSRMKRKSYHKTAFEAQMISDGILECVFDSIISLEVRRIILYYNFWTFTQFSKTKNFKTSTCKDSEFKWIKFSGSTVSQFWLCEKWICLFPQTP